MSATGSAPQNETVMRMRAEQSIKRALALDSDNPHARLAQSILQPSFGRWLQEEALVRSILKSHPKNEAAWGWLCGLLLGVGRCTEAANAFAHFWTLGPPDPARTYTRIVAFWASDRIDEADKAAAEATELFPTHFATWFTRFYLLLYTGRPAEALAMSRRVDQRPIGIPEENFTMIEQVAQAMISRAPADIDRALATNIAAAHKGAGFAENTIQFAAALGRIDTAFEVAQAYYFGRGFEVGELRFQPEQRVYTRRNQRRTRMLFMPSTTARRADPRFDALVGEIGLKRYWAQSGTLPDYLRNR